MPAEAGVVARFAAALGGLLLAACGTEGSAGSRLAGRVRVDGSSTVYPITEAVAEEFGKRHAGVRVTVGVSGTTGGFEKFLHGEIEVNDASRPVSAREAGLAQARGHDFVELPIALDGIAVVVNPANRFATVLSTGQLRRIWRAGSTVARWSDVDPSWPDQPLRLYGPGTDSGTFQHFTRTICRREGDCRQDFVASEDDNRLVLGVAGDPGALGYFGFAYWVENRERLRLVAVDAGAGPRLPSPATIGDGSYAPLSRPLFLYVSRRALADPALAAFAEFYLDQAPRLVEEVGYVGLPRQAYEMARTRLRQRIGGSLYGGRDFARSVVDLLRAATPERR